MIKSRGEVAWIHTAPAEYGTNCQANSEGATPVREAQSYACCKGIGFQCRGSRAE